MTQQVYRLELTGEDRDLLLSTLALEGMESRKDGLPRRERHLNDLYDKVRALEPVGTGADRERADRGELQSLGASAVALSRIR